jgi:hypothetical protein
MSNFITGLKQALSSRNTKLLVAVLSLVAAVFVALAELSVAQVPNPPPPTCVSCPKGYHCAHNPERCVPD